MSDRVRSLAVLLLAVGLLTGAAVASTGDDVTTSHEGEDHSDGGGNPLPAPSPILVLTVVGLAAAALRRSADGSR